ncbi:uncharacterized protein TM35_000161090 [Trypanosoma theileri]|uniref:Uncharacterized protein n=1 Tax=Trypanosoma theileri TaxID=67003 RepID=A0A1X0NV35_9TRYP|nr:uncharacterized protein TM35_000161090 [Trypanosoma theileri]ORC88471.1 hypothetical protein TM35_000161090 [Trypanosoma theileri]
MGAEDVAVPRRNPFRTPWRTNLPSFHDCLASLGPRGDLRGLGEALAASSPPPRGPGPDLSFRTLDVSDPTPPGSPPPPLERPPPSRASSTEETPTRGEPTTPTPKQRPPLCPNVSPIAHSPSVGDGPFSLPRTEPLEVLGVSPADRIFPTMLKDGRGVERGTQVNHPVFSEPHIVPLEGVGGTSVYVEPLQLEGEEEYVVEGELCSVRRRAEVIVPPLCELSGGSWLIEPTYRWGDFAYHHPVLYRIPANSTGDDGLFRGFSLY